MLIKRDVDSICISVLKEKSDLKRLRSKITEIKRLCSLCNQNFV